MFFIMHFGFFSFIVYVFHYALWVFSFIVYISSDVLLLFWNINESLTGLIHFITYACKVNTTIC